VSLAAFAMFAIGGLVAQSQPAAIHSSPISARQLQVPLESGELIWNWQPFPGGDIVVKGTGPRSSLLKLSEGLPAKALDVGAMIAAPSTSAIAGNWAFVLEERPASLAGHLVNLTSGTSAPLALTGIPYFPAIDGDRLAILVDRNGSAFLEVYDCLDLHRTHEIPVAVEAPNLSMVVFTAPDRLLIVELVTARITPVSLAGGGVVSEKIQLRGVDIGLATQPAVKTIHRGPPSPRLALRPNFAMSAIGNYLFAVLSGPALVVGEFSPDGAEVQSHHLDYAREARTVVDSEKLKVQSNGLFVLGRDGVVRQFERM
jgi:hypothetical protein